MKSVVRKGNGAILDYITRSISEGIASRFLVRDELEKNFQSLVSKNIISSETSNRILNELTSTEMTPGEDKVIPEIQEKGLETDLSNLQNTINENLEKL